MNAVIHNYLGARKMLILPFILILMILINNLISFARTKTNTEIKENQGWLGVVIEDVNNRIAKKLKLDTNEGAYIKMVLEGSPADSAGIMKGDVIIEFDSKKVLDANDLAKSVAKMSPGTKVKVITIRDGEKKNFEVVIGSKRMRRHERFCRFFRIPEFKFKFNDRIIGLKVSTLSEQLAEYFEVPGKEGVLVEEVKKGSVCEKAGFKAGDVITKIGKKSVDGVEKLCKEIDKYETGDKIEFEVFRKGVKKTFTIELEDHTMGKKEFYFPFPVDKFDIGSFLENIEEMCKNIDLEFKIKCLQEKDSDKVDNEIKARCLPPQNKYIKL